MERASARCLLLFVTSAFLMTVTVAPVLARVNPAKPLLGSGPAAAPAAGQAFDCGTYRGNESETPWLRDMHYAQQRRIAKERALRGETSPPAPPSHFVHDGVWVVTDDGTLTFSGLNVFDTDLQTIRFTPNGPAYDVTSEAAAWDPVFGPNLFLGDDQSVPLAVNFTFTYYGVGHTLVYVSSNGAVGLSADPNPSGFFDNNDFFNTAPKIAAYFMDLNPASSGSVHYRADPDKSVITWNNVVEFGTGITNSLQLVLYDTGVFDVRFNGINSTTANNGTPIAHGSHPGGSGPNLELISFSNDLPYMGGSGAGIYETYQNITNPLVNEVGLFQFFYTVWPDKFFQLIFFTNFIQTMGGFANERNLSNNATGIGLGIFDQSGTYGSAGVLESRCNMNRLAVWNTDPTFRFFSKGNNFLTIMGQEAGHRWGAFVTFLDTLGSASNLILGRSNAHWSYYVDVDHSSLEGGNWELFAPSTYICPTQVDHFGQIDEYTFGLRTPEEVAATFYVASPTNDQPAARSVGTPNQNDVSTGTAVVVTIGDIIAAEGPRIPAERPDKDICQAFIFLLANSTTASPTELNKIAGFRSAWEPYFEVAVDGRLAVNTVVDSQYCVGVVEGHVQDFATGDPIDDVIVESLERGFVQVVPAGGRYTFRYMAGVTSASSELVTLAVSATGYLPDTLVVLVPCDSTLSIDLELVSTTVTGIGDEGGNLPDVPRLRSTYPNPFNPQTTITYDVARTGRVHVGVYDVQGRLIRTLVDRSQVRATHTVRWEGTDDRGVTVSSGVYFVRLWTREGVETRKITFLK